MGGEHNTLQRGTQHLGREEVQGRLDGGGIHVDWDYPGKEHAIQQELALGTRTEAIEEWLAAWRYNQIGNGFCAIR